jgi:hypothetical protein
MRPRRLTARKIALVSNASSACGFAVFACIATAPKIERRISDVADE